MKIKTKILIVTSVSILLLVVFILSFVINNLKKNNLESIESIKKSYMAVQEQRLKDIMELAKNSIKDLYDDDSGDITVRQEEAKKRLSNMLYDKDGYIFVSDNNGTFLVHINNSLIGKKSY